MKQSRRRLHSPSSHPTIRFEGVVLFLSDADSQQFEWDDTFGLCDEAFQIPHRPRNPDKFVSFSLSGCSGDVPKRQRGPAVNRLLRLRRFESCRHHENPNIRGLRRIIRCDDNRKRAK